MNNKSEKVTAILKGRRQQEQKKVPGSEGPFNPVHVSKKSDQTPESPNQYAHRVSEAMAPPQIIGGKRRPVKTYQASTKGGKGLVTRYGARASGAAQSLKNRYEEEVELKNKVLKKVKRMKEEQGAERTDNLGRPDTGGVQDTVTVSPKKEELTGQLK